MSFGSCDIAMQKGSLYWFIGKGMGVFNEYMGKSMRN